MMKRNIPRLLVFLSIGFSAMAAPVPPTDGLAGKVVCGYQGWFRCEGDGSGLGWQHYGVKGKFAPGFAHIDLWPEVGELPAADRFATPFRHADGRGAEVFSSVRPGAVDVHFRWMREHGIDGVMLQRFARPTKDPKFRAAMDQVLANVRASSARHGRGWALMYDLSGLKPGEADVVIKDWQHLREEKRVELRPGDPFYFHHRGKPLVALWGLGFSDREPMLDDWEKLITFFKGEQSGGACALMLGVPYHWRSLGRDSIKDPRLHQLLARADIVSPWSVGRLKTVEDAAARVESTLIPDRKKAMDLGLDYLPVVFPGFSWHNLQKSRGQEAKLNAIPRQGGKFFWAQAVAARRAGAEMIYVAMFDELDEGTAIFKTTSNPPVGDSPFVSEPGVASDHYLKLTGKIGRLMRGEISLEKGP